MKLIDELAPIAAKQIQQRQEACRLVGERVRTIEDITGLKVEAGMGCINIGLNKEVECIARDDNNEPYTARINVTNSACYRCVPDIKDISLKRKYQDAISLWKNLLKDVEAYLEYIYSTEDAFLYIAECI